MDGVNGHNRSETRDDMKSRLLCATLSLTLFYDPAFVVALGLSWYRIYRKGERVGGTATSDTRGGDASLQVVRLSQSPRSPNYYPRPLTYEIY